MKRVVPLVLTATVTLLACDPTLVPVNPPEPGDGAEWAPRPAPSAVVIVVSPAASPAATPSGGLPFPINTSVQEALPSGLGYTIVRPGGANSPVAENGNTVAVHYTGWLVDGKTFDSSRPRQQPFRFKLGAGLVIRGWDEGVRGMRVGEWRKLVIPSRLAYGESGTRSIPPRSTLIFEVELLAVE
jgi:hypothetical protein